MILSYAPNAQRLFGLHTKTRSILPSEDDPELRDPDPGKTSEFLKQSGTIAATDEAANQPSGSSPPEDPDSGFGLSRGTNGKFIGRWPLVDTMLLIELKEKGLSASECMPHFTYRYTRNAIIGRWTRIKKAQGLHEAPKIRVPKEPVESIWDPRIRKKRQAPLAIARAAPHTLGGGEVVTIADLQTYQCRWPLGDPMEDGFGYCGKRRHSRRVLSDRLERQMTYSYCREHCRIGYEGFER